MLSFSHLYLPTNISGYSFLTKLYKHSSLDKPTSLVSRHLSLINIVSSKINNIILKLTQIWIQYEILKFHFIK